VNTDQSLYDALLLLAEAEAYIALGRDPKAADLLEQIVVFQHKHEAWAAVRENAES
jgi:hypothetical protein